MSEDVQQGVERVRKLILEAELARAADLAHDRRFSDAEAVLTRILREHEQSPKAFDLLARIRVHQGRLPEARRLWNAALAADPKNESYSTALGRIDDGGRPLRSTFFWLLLAAGVIVSLVLALVLAGPRLRNRQLALSAEKSGAPSHNENPLKQIETPGEKPLMFKINGAAVENEGNQQLVIFDQGLFRRAADLDAVSKRRLDDLGQQLKSYVDAVTVTVEGHASSVPLKKTKIFQDNASLGFARAVTVINYIRSSNRLPAEMFTATSSEASPYPDDSTENQLRNQTVTIRIVRRK